MKPEKKKPPKPLSMHGHKPEDVLGAFMQVMPERVEKRLKRKGLSRKKV